MWSYFLHMAKCMGCSSLSSTRIARGCLIQPSRRPKARQRLCREQGASSQIRQMPCTHQRRRAAAVLVRQVNLHSIKHRVTSSNLNVKSCRFLAACVNEGVHRWAISPLVSTVCCRCTGCPGGASLHDLLHQCARHSSHLGHINASVVSSRVFSQS
jgi:hypothetical protein